MCESEKRYTKCKSDKHCKRVNFQLFKISRNKFDRALRQAQRNYKKKLVNDLENFNTRNPKDFWNHLKSLGPKKKAEIPMQVQIEEKNVFETNTILQKWQNDFCNLYNKPNNINFDRDFYINILRQKCALENSDYINYEIQNDPLNKPFCHDELKQVIKRLKTNKAVGCDNIPNEVLKQRSVSEMLLKYFQTCFESGIVPTIWLKSIINPIPKDSKKNPYVPLNYRGISLLSCVSKVYSSLINKRITSYCNISDLIVDEQNGFRSGRSCEEHTFTLTCLIRNQLSKSKSVFASFIDLEKAFDWVDRDLLFYRLLTYGITGKIYKAIKSLYNNTFSCVRVNNWMTGWFSVSSGVKQGDNLSPTLFSIYINDLAVTLKELNLGIDINGQKLCILLYADDLVLIAENEKDLQTLLNKMNEWCLRWKLNININKSNVVHFRPVKKRRSKFNFQYGNTQLNYCSSYKYLGTYLDEHLKFTQCISTLSDSGSRSLGSICSKLKYLKDVRFKTYTKLYNAHVCPILDYGASVWGYKNSAQCDSVQNKAIRYFLGVHKFTPLAAINGEMGWLPCKYRHYLCMLRLWNRLIKMDSSRITKKVFLWDYEKCTANWSNDIREILRLINMQNHFISKTPVNTKHVKELFMAKTENDWKLELESKPKLRVYKTFKNKYETENYLNTYISKSKRSLLVQFRTGVLPLRIETGRFHLIKDTSSNKLRKLNVDERTCLLCKSNEVEDEIHFLCHCVAYENLRSNLFKSVVQNIPQFHSLSDNEKFVIIVNSYEKQLVDFIYQAWRIRQDLLNK